MEGNLITLRLFLLGSPRLEGDGATVRIGRRKALALLAYLAVIGQPQNRDALLPLLWPHNDTASARSNLRRDLSYLRSKVGAATIPGDHQQLRFDPAAGLWVDVLAFRELLIGNGRDSLVNKPPPDLEKLAQAVALAGGDFMAGFGLDDAPAFDDWQYFQASALRHDLASALKTLMAALQAAGAYEEALAYARRWLALDPLHEPAQRELMQLLAWSGQTAAALDQYAVSKRLLRDELGVEPEAATTELVAAIQERRLAVPVVARARDRPVAAATTAEPQPTQSAAPAPRHNLPIPPTPFIGRERELAELDGLLLSQGQRLVTILGPGGMGKTRLALALARQLLAQAEKYADGIFFVNLAPLSDADHLPVALAEALGFPLDTLGEARRPPRQQILDFLGNKKLLLILDNCEHLLDGAELIADLLQGSAGVQILATSRERLHLQSEQRFFIVGLAAAGWATLAEAQTQAAVQLFVQSARRIRPDFQLANTDLPALNQLCQLVGGLPLALELAASWVELLPLGEIVAELSGSLDFLASQMRDLKVGHSSIRAVFSGTWERLSRDEQQIFSQLTVFRGGFTRRAAQAVTSADLRQLSNLTSKSLLQYDGARDRYQIHELLRQFGAEQLAREPVLAEDVQAGHCRYYLEAVAERRARLQGEEQQTALAEIEADIENVRQAWGQAVKSGADDLLAASLDGLGYFLEWRGRYQDGLEMLTGRFNPEAPLLQFSALVWQAVFASQTAAVDDAQRLLAAAWTTAPSAERHPLPVAQAYWRQGQLAIGRDNSAAVAAFRQGVALLVQTEHRWQKGQLHLGLGETYWFLGQYDDAQRELAQSHAIFERLGDHRSLTETTRLLSTIARYQGRGADALRYAEASMRHSEALGNQLAKAVALNNLALTLSFFYGQTEEAIALNQQSIEICTGLNALPQLCYGLTFQAEFLRQAGQLQQATAVNEQGIALARKMDHPQYLASLLVFKGLHLPFAAGKPYLEEALVLSRQVSYRDFELMAHTFLEYDEERSFSDVESIEKLVDFLTISLAERRFYQLQYPMIALWQILIRRLRDKPPAADRPLLITCLELRYTLGLNPANQITLSSPRFQYCREWEQQLQDANIIRETQIAKRDTWEMAAELLRVLTESGWTELQPITTTLSQTVPDVPKATRHNLPAQPTPFIGRERELADLDGLVADPNKRLITIVAPGGMGKTRLALAAAEQQLTGEFFPQGVYFVGLAPLSDPVHLPAAMAEAFGLPLAADGPQRRTPQQQVLDYLSDKQLLLLLDNFEHLLEGVDLVTAILERAPEVQIVATARERLNLRAEQLFSIRGLQFPEWETPEDAAEYTAARLFLQRARQIQADFVLQGNDVTYLSRICRLVAGMPLAVELAAGWVDTLSLADIAAEIQRGLDFLATDFHDVAERHRSIRAVFDSTWARLSTAEQTVFAQLSVFRGSFTLEAVQAVTGASLRTLANLTNKSLLTYNRTQDRYQLHDLLRQYANGQLATTALAVADVRSRHGSYYLNMLAASEDEFKGSRQQTAMNTIEAELSNILLAWEWAILSADDGLLLHGMETLGLFYEWQGRFEDGQIAFDQLLRSLNEPMPDDDPQIWARACGWAGVFHRFTSGYDTAFALLQDGLKSLQFLTEDNPSIDQVQGSLLMRLGQCELSQHYEASLEAFTASVDVFRKLGLSWELAWSLKGLGEAAWGKGLFEVAAPALDESLRRFRSLGDQRGIAAAALFASTTARYSGYENIALELAQECLAASQQITGLGQYAAALNNLANTLSFMFGRYAEALALQVESSEIVSALGNPLQRSEAFFGLACRYQSMGRLNEARENYELAINWAEKTGQNHILSNAMGSLGLMLAFTGDFRQGFSLITEAQKIAADIGGEAMVTVSGMWSLMAEILHRPDPSQKRRALSALTQGWQTRSFYAADTAIMAIRALLLREPLTAEGGPTRSHLLALEIDAMHKGGNAGKQWDMAVLEGGRLQEVIGRLPAHVVEQTQARGRSRQWWEMVAYLLDVLPEMGWDKDEPALNDLGKST